MTSNTRELSNLFAKHFIARTDVKAIQFGNGAWAPHLELNPTTGRHDGPRIPWRRKDLEAHIEGRETFGHYLLSVESQCKLFAFDVDLTKTGLIPSVSSNSVSTYEEWAESFEEVSDLRAIWLDRRHPGRDYLKLQFKTMAHMLMRAIEENLGIPAVAAYSGGKGIHVYGLTGLISAAEAREGARIVLDAIGNFKPLRGDNFFAHTNNDPVDGFPNLSIELFPKQNSLDGKDLGNLMRLPLGKNKKSKDPTFFIDMRTPLGVMAPRDPVEVLTVGSQWE